MGSLRAAAILGGFFTLTVPLMPVQAALLRVSPRGARRFPNWYHRQVCRLLGVRLHIEGAIAPDRPVLVVANHTSWLDIPVLSAVAPLSFVAKKDVARWPFVSTLA
ncbi:MAG TPA: lysophospholipid acyltransferase family protein, partial [Hyphomicrobium sp.]|nr:lysophospholipid acyltransferase family protein [Hyphomicrobium sp.]HRO51204.1 lysophospholipid acyltransferase family protein [Hyphomicrobium sp.]